MSNRPTLDSYISTVANADLKPNSIDLVVCSPPYKKRDGYTDELPTQLLSLCEMALRPGGRCFVNFGQAKESFSRPFIVRDLMSQGELEPTQTIIWANSIAIFDKQIGHIQPINSKHLLYYSFEYIFQFYKPPEEDIDRLSIGVPYADITNLSRGTRGKNGNIHCAGDIWFIPYETRGASSKKSHVHEYPKELVRRCVKLSGIKPGSTVLDPFCGGGTTAVIAKELGMNAVILDRSKDVIIKARARWEKE